MRVRKDYYVVLGVPSSATSRHIRKAFHQLSKRYHPDRAGSEGTRQFQDIVEAYEVLSDPEKRRTYNESLADRDFRTPPVDLGGYTTVVEPLAQPGKRRVVEPLVPEDPVPGWAEPVSVPFGFRGVRPSAEEMTDRFLRNFTGFHVPKAERAEGLNVEVVLSPQAALRGGRLTLRVPVFSQCPLCAGSGRDWFSPCDYCRGRGVIREEEDVRVGLPPGIREGRVVEVPLAGSGIANFHLRIHVRISPSAL